MAAGPTGARLSDTPPHAGFPLQNDYPMDRETASELSGGDGWTALKPLLTHGG